MAYQLPVASQSDSDLASLSDLWFEMPSPVSSPSRPNNPASSPKGKSSAGDQNGYHQPPADNSGFRPGLPTNNSKGPNSPSPITNKGVAASPTSSSTSPAPSSSLQPNQGPTNSNSPPRRRPSLADPSTLQTFYNNPPPPRLQTDLSSLHLLPQLTTQPSPTTTSSPVSHGFRGLGRSPTRHNPSNSHSSFFQDPASAMAAVAPSPTSLPYQHQQQQQQQLHHHVPGGGGKRFVPTMSDAAKLDRSRTLVRNLMGSSSIARRNEAQGNRERSPNGENEARGSARSGSGQSTPLQQHQGYAMENGRSRTSSYNQQSSLPSPSLARPDEEGGRRETTTIAAPSSLPTSPPSQVQSFESFVGSDGELRRVLIDGRLFQFDSTGTKLSLIDRPPPPTTQVVSPPPANLALPLTPTPVTTIEPPKPSTSATSPAAPSTFTPPPKPANLTIDSSVHNPPTNGRASQAFYGDLLGDFGASPTVEAHPDRIRQTIMGSRLTEDSPDSLRSSEEEHWQQQAMRNEGAELAQQQLQEQQNQQQQQQPSSSSKRGGFIEPRLTAGEGERKKIVSSAEQLRTLEAKYGIEPRQKSPPQPRATALPSEPQPPPKQQAPPPLEPRAQTQPRLPFQPQSPPRQLPTRHQTSPPTSSHSSSPTKPSFPPLETKFSSSSIHNPTSPPNAQPSLPHAHPHHPPFQVVDTPSSLALPPPPPDVKEPPAIAPPPSRPAPPPQRVISPASSDDDDYSDDDATPLAFSTKPRPPALPPKDAQAPSSSSAGPSSSQQNQIPRRPAREQPPPRASTEDWVVPSPIERPSSSGRPTDPYEVLSRPMPRELDTGGRFGEKLKRGVTGLRKELKKGMTQVQALRPNAPTSPSSPLNTLSSSPHPHHAPHHGHSQSHSNPHSHSQAPPLHTRTNSSEPNKHQSPTDHQQHAALPPRPPSPMREALAPQSMTGIEVAERAALIEDEEERKLAESMFM